MKHGYSRATFQANLSELLRAGLPRNQAVAVAMKAARESFFKRYPKGALPSWLTPNNGKRTKNPVPPSRKVQLREAVKLYEDFTGHDGETVAVIDKPVIPDVMILVGEVDGILYSTVRDGVYEKYIHEFNRKSRPLFAVSHDGKSLHMLGGAYDFTDRGIVDRRKT